MALFRVNVNNAYIGLISSDVLKCRIAEISSDFTFRRLKKFQTVP
jgi:hypothetical protein